MSAKRIVIDARMYQESGIGRYIRNLIFNLQIIDKKNHYLILHLRKDYDSLVYHNNFQKILADFPWYGVKEQFKLPKLLQSLQADFTHFPHFNVPFVFDGKYVVTIHDLIHQHFSMQRATTHGLLIYKLKQLGYKKVFNTALKKSTKIFAPSNFVKNQLIKEWNVANNKVVVTYEGVEDDLLKFQNKNTAKINYPFIFYIGNAHPHKNIEGLIKAFLKVKKKSPKLKLVLAGYDHYFWQRIKKKYQNEDIIYKGHISDEKMVNMYQNAKCFVMPSFEEGFGIPILEAMAFSCPVVSSNAVSLQEIGGNCAVYFDPLNINDMAEKILTILEDNNLRKELIKKGLKRYRQFSWKKLAQKTLEVYNQCV